MQARTGASHKKKQKCDRTMIIKLVKNQRVKTTCKTKSCESARSPPLPCHSERADWDRQDRAESTMHQHHPARDLKSGGNCSKTKSTAHQLISLPSQLTKLALLFSPMLSMTAKMPMTLSSGFTGGDRSPALPISVATQPG